MSWVNQHLRSLAAALLTVTLASFAANAADQDKRSPAWRDQLAGARASYYAGLEGNRDADAEARRRFESLGRQQPQDPTVAAYIGSLQLLEAGRTWAVWRKHALSADGLSQMDAAVQMDPSDLEARFVRALTTWHLPFFFHRKQQAEDDLLYLGPRAEQAARSGALPAPLAAAALDYWGQVLADRNHSDEAHRAFLAAVRVDPNSSGGKDAAQRLH